ncbi:MFS transporter [Tepidanaerobacter sp. EBM-49]|uniref:MFS transporter n=1 Tax=Tepidanaerobacter sp. EBM-49 TaxID=1918504 RepID=UPI000ACCEE35|nr:MFS transporter [Tepidanaerobacter sp. EBM-49]
MAENNKSKDFIMVLLATVAFVSTYYIMMPAIPVYMLELGFDNLTIGTTMGLFSISSMLARPIGGIWINTYTSKKVMLISIALFFLTPLLLKTFPALAGLSLTLLIYGFTVGAFSVASANFTADISSSENLVRFMGFNSVAVMIAKGLAPAAGVKLINNYNFNVAVYSTVAAAVFALILLTFVSDIKVDTKKEEDSNFIRVLLNKSVYLPTIVLFCGMTTFGAISAMLPLFAAAKNITGTEYFFVINTAVVVTTRLLVGRWSNKYLEQIIAFALLDLTVSLILMSFVNSFQGLIVVAIIYGLGFALLFPFMTSLLVLTIRGISRSTALGAFTAAFDLGVAAGVTLGGFSEYMAFERLYLFLAAIPFIGYLIYQYIYRPYIRQLE